MKNKVILVCATICICAVCLSGCGSKQHVCIDPGGLDSYTYIYVDKDYKLKDYSKEYTENGCDVTIHFEKDE